MAEEEILIPQSFFQSQYSKIDFPETETNNEFLRLSEDIKCKDYINHKFLKYTAGYVAYKFKKKYNLESATSINELDSGIGDGLFYISRGGFLNANDDLRETAAVLDTEFRVTHGNSSIRKKGDCP